MLSKHSITVVYTPTNSLNNPVQLQLATHNLSKAYYELQVFSNISITIQKGEFVSILGPSGCGKTTLLHCIADIEKPTTGKIITNDNPGYMLQKALLLPWRTTLENTMLGLLLKGIPQQKAKQEATTILKKFHLDEFANHYPATLSGGMAQRVALLRTILFNNQFLLMDEPFGALDALTRISMQMWLLEVWEKYKSSVFLVTHDIREAILLSDKIYILGNKPTTVIKEIIIDIPRPRRRDMLQQKKALEIERSLENLLLTNIYD